MLGASERLQLHIVSRAYGLDPRIVEQWPTPLYREAAASIAAENRIRNKKRPKPRK